MEKVEANGIFYGASTRARARARTLLSAKASQNGTGKGGNRADNEFCDLDRASGRSLQWHRAQTMGQGIERADVPSNTVSIGKSPCCY